MMPATRRDRWIAARDRAARPGAAATVIVTIGGRGPGPMVGDPVDDLRHAVLIARALIRRLVAAKLAADGIVGSATLAGAQARAQAISDAIANELGDFFDETGV